MPRKATAKKATKKTTTRKVKAVRKTTKKAPAKKTAAKKTTARKTTAKKATAKKATAKKATAKKTTATRKPSTSPIKDPFSKSQLINTIVEETGFSKKDINAVLESLGGIIGRHVKKNAAGQFTLPGLLKIVIQRKPATKARKGINPFTGEETMFKAKPARRVVKIRPLKKLKDMAA